MHKPKERERAAPPGPTYMSSQQMSSFLQDLRASRPSRPVGSRPPPAHFNTWSSRTSSRFIETPAVSPFSHSTFTDAGVDVETPPQPAPESKPHRRTTSNMSIDEVLAGKGGRALVQPPRGREVSVTSTTRERTPSIQYRESGRRQVEREEARELRIAMEELDLKQEQNLYDSARDEAAELVWKHQNPNAPENQPGAPYAYPGLSGNNGHQRSQSLDRAEQNLQRSHSKLRKRSSMGSSTAGSRSSSLQSRRATSGSSVTANAGFSTSPTKEDFKETNNSEEITALPKISTALDTKHRRRSSSSKRKVSGSLFKNPDDQIYEEPEEDIQPATTAAAPVVANAPPLAKLPLQVRRNPFSRVQFAKDHNLVRSNTDPVLGTNRFDRYEIQRNPPSQSRNAAYTSNVTAPLMSKPTETEKSDVENDPEIKMKDGKEVRSEDIRAATGFRLRDRSPKLPTPTAVSDSPGRPIVSFRNDWKLKEIELKQENSQLQSTPKATGPIERPLRPLSKAITAPAVPTIHVQDEPQKNSVVPSPTPIPQISVSPTSSTLPSRISRAQAPVISVYEDPPARPLPNATTSRQAYTPLLSATPPVPTINVSQAPPARSKPSPTPPIPTISIQETPSVAANPTDQSVKTPLIPMISINEPSVPIPQISAPSIPSISVDGPVTSTRPLPTPTRAGTYPTQPFPRNNARNNRSHWTPTSVRTGALCVQCALPISGRIVSAAGSRFHPECFLCHHCGEHLECVAFYPEPDNKRAERIARIQSRLRGEDIEFLPTHPTHEDMLRLEAEDGDESPRFFCHLDFHELYSPRCKSCKTPIEGEVVVACGAEWHVGHFFCAQCGDPFDSATPFVEKDGYAWCVGCHTNRYSTKCRKCRKPVTDTVVKALGSEWHMGCFCCVECSGPFEDGRYFLRGDSQDPVCVKCEERRLKA